MRPLRLPVLPDGRGHRLPETLDALDRRNALLAEAARRFFVGVSDREAARQLRIKLLRYQTGPWRRTRSDLICRHQAGRLEALLWELLKVRDALVSERTIRAALSFAAAQETGTVALPMR